MSLNNRRSFLLDRDLNLFIISHFDEKTLGSFSPITNEYPDPIV